MSRAALAAELILMLCVLVGCGGSGGPKPGTFQDGYACLTGETYDGGLVAGCDEFLFYDDMVSAAERPRPRQRKATKGGKATKAGPDAREQGIDQVLEIIFSLSVDYEPLWGSMVKQAIKRRKPGFNESYYGFRAFSQLLEAAERQGLVELELDDRSGGYIVRAVYLDE